MAIDAKVTLCRILVLASHEPPTEWQCLTWKYCVGLPLQWNLETVCSNMVRRQTIIAAECSMAFKHHLLSTPEFLDQINDCPSLLRSDALSVNWVMHKRRKRRWLRWEETAFALAHNAAVRSVAERTLEFWANQDSAEIKSLIFPTHTANRQFTCRLKFYRNLEHASRTIS